MQGRKIKGNVLDVRPQWRVRSRWANATDSPSPPTLDNALIHLCSGLQQKYTQNVSQKISIKKYHQRWM